MHDRLLGADPAETSLSALTDRAVRALTLILPETEWQVLRRVEPDPLGWLRTQVHRRLDETDAWAPTSERD